MYALFKIDIEWFLSRMKIVETDLEDPPITSQQGRFFINIERKPSTIETA